MTENTVIGDFGPIQKLMEDTAISEIMINGAGKVFAERNGKKVLTDATFKDEEEIMKLIQGIYSARSKRIDKDVPYADVCMEDGTRINAIIKPICRFGMAVTIRKFSQDVTNIEDLIRLGTLDRRMADFLIACIKGKVNMLFSGGTATGKTTALQILSSYFDPKERVITIEDAAELRMAQENVISLETRTPDNAGKGEVTIRDLIRNAMRMAPDRVVIGEVRGAESIEMIQAMATGHSGTLGVIHGSSPRQVIARLETMILASGISLALAEVRKLIATTVQLVVHVERMLDGSRKITSITEIRGMDSGEIVFNDIFIYEMEKYEEGKVIGKFRSSIRFYPLFFQRLQKLKLVYDKIFVND